MWRSEDNFESWLTSSTVSSWKQIQIYFWSLLHFLRQDLIVTWPASNSLMTLNSRFSCLYLKGQNVFSELGMAVYSFDPSIWKAETGRSLWGQHGLQKFLSLKWWGVSGEGEKGREGSGHQLLSIFFFFLMVLGIHHRFLSIQASSLPVGLYP